MNGVKFSEAASFCHGKISGTNPDAFFTGVSTDTRKVGQKSLFVALKGDRFDAHDFVGAAIAQGAAGVVVEESRGIELPAGAIKIEVTDTLIALQQIAAGYRRKLPVKTVAVTGSNGKTSTKEFTAAVLSKGFVTRKTLGNLNNHIGVPLTIFQLDTDTQMGVIEMGMNHAGELAPLMEIAQPIIGIVTNVSPVHIENFKDENGIAEEKATVVRGIPADGHAIINLDDKWCPIVSKGVTAKIMTFGINNQSATLWADAMSTGKDGIRYTLHHEGKSYPAFSPVFGEHMVYNAMAGSLAGLISGLSWEAICAGLAEVQLPGMRMQQLQIKGVNLINDAYNANPVSMAAGLKTLKTVGAGTNCFAVVGTMYELGSLAVEEHKNVGRLAAELGLDGLFARGEFATQIIQGAREAGMKPGQVSAVNEALEIATLLNQQCKPGDHVLIKGSRGAKMEEVVAAWQQLAQ